MPTVRAVTYNIYLGGKRGRPVQEVIRAVAPDVLLVNEAPKWPFVWRRRCQRLVDAWGMIFVTGGRPAGSNMIAVDSRVSVNAAGSVVLPQPLFRPRRGIAWAQLNIGGGRLGVVCCHLSLQRNRRLGEVKRVLEVAGRLRGPVVVAGDLNEEPGGPSWQRLESAGFADPGSDAWLTFPAHEPTKRIDALLVRGAVRVEWHGDPGVPDQRLSCASDHRPVMAHIHF